MPSTIPTRTHITLPASNMLRWCFPPQTKGLKGYKVQISSISLLAKVCQSVHHPVYKQSDSIYSQIPLTFYSLQPFCFTRSSQRFRYRMRAFSDPDWILAVASSKIIERAKEAMWYKLMLREEIEKEIQNRISPSVASFKVLFVIIQHGEKITACQSKHPIYGLTSNLWLHLLSANEVCRKL